MNMTNSTNFSTNQLQSGTSPVAGTVDRPEPYVLRVSSLLFFSVIILASLMGNTLVLKAVIALPARCKPFTYYLVANLAGAEIISSLCQPFIMAYQELYSWIFGEFTCKLLIPLQVLAVIVVTSDMATIAVYRYTRIMTPKKKASGLVMAAIIGGIWLAALAVSLPLFVTRILLELPSGHKLCYSKFPGGGYNTYSIIRFTLCFLVPYLIMMWSYGAVALKLKRHIRRNVEESSEITMMSSRKSSDDRRAVLHLHYGAPPREVHLEVPKRNPRPGNKSRAELESDLLRMIYVIILSFVVCYIPYQILFLWEYSTAESNRWQFRYQAMIRKYFYILTCLPSAIHPLCYGTMNRFFAQAFSKIVMCRR
ncbi:neuropeptide Y receptor type 2-like [Oculina patagonica]